MILIKWSNIQVPVVQVFLCPCLHVPFHRNSKLKSAFGGAATALPRLCSYDHDLPCDSRSRQPVRSPSNNLPEHSPSTLPALSTTDEIRRLYFQRESAGSQIPSWGFFFFFLPSTIPQYVCRWSRWDSEASRSDEATRKPKRRVRSAWNIHGDEMGILQLKLGRVCLC